MFQNYFEFFDDRFKKLLLPNVHIEQLWTGGRWLEGPVYVAAGKYLLFSDIPNNRIMRWDETDGSVSVFQSEAGYHNGHTLDREGRIVSCEHGSRSISRFEHDGTKTTLVTHFGGKRLNSPNDVIVKSDGTIWFTDPTYGIDSDYEGHAANAELSTSNVFRFDPVTKLLTIIADDFVQPNGLAFNHDETVLYVVDSGVTHLDNGPRHLRTLSLNPDGSITNDHTVLSTCSNGIYDGMRLDEHGNIWISAADGIHCLSSTGELLGKISVPETVSNIVFGGPKNNRLFICATRSLYSVYLPVRGLYRTSSGDL